MAGLRINWKDFSRLRWIALACSIILATTVAWKGYLSYPVCNWLRSYFASLCGIAQLVYGEIECGIQGGGKREIIEASR